MRIALSADTDGAAAAALALNEGIVKVIAIASKNAVILLMISSVKYTNVNYSKKTPDARLKFELNGNNLGIYLNLEVLL